jgi:hypothetical protein
MTSPVATLGTGDSHQLDLPMTSQMLPDKLQFSGHETFPLRQLWLRKAYTAVSGSDDPSAVFTSDDAIRRFGVGKNMVSAIRHWALATGVLTEDESGKVVASEFGEFLFGRRGVDPYLEHPATCWLVHWNLSSRALRSVTWHWVFNRVSTPTFDREILVSDLERLASDRRARASATTIKRDVDVCIRCYVPKRDAREGDDAAEPLLAELNLMTEGPSGVFHFRRGAQPSLPDEVFAFALVDYWRRWEASTGSSQKTLSFESVAHDYASPGRTFKLDENAVAERLIRLEDLTSGELRWTDSAGLRQVSRSDRMDSLNLLTILRSAYGR